MTKDLRKVIMIKSKAKSQYVKWHSKENYLAFKKAKNKCTSINKKTKKDYFKGAAKYGVMTNKEFWKKLKPFLTNEGGFLEDKINIEVNDDVVSDKKSLQNFLTSIISI